jgi:hypothetical protein
MLAVEQIEIEWGLYDWFRDRRGGVLWLNELGQNV